MSISRRRALKAIAGAAAMVTAAVTGGSPATRALVRAANAADDDHGHEQDYQWAFVVDMRRCDGCKECTVACQVTHALPETHEWIKIYEIHHHDGSVEYMPRTCQHCEQPPCLKVCPVGATFKGQGGIVLVDQDRCIGCRACMAACPYNARYFNYWEIPNGDQLRGGDPSHARGPEYPIPQVIGTVGKCVFCVHFAEEGRLPACIEACRMNALYIADLNMDVMTNAAGETYKLSEYLHEHDAFQYRAELNTVPRVWYVSGHGQALGGRRWS